MNRPHLALLVTTAFLLALPVGADDTKPPASPPSGKITPQTRMLLIRDLTAEHCFARRSLPMGHKGLEIKHGVVTPNDAQVAQLIAENGLVAKPGDSVVITNVLIEEKAIVLEINGGPKKKEKWYQHVQVGMGGVMTTPGPAPKNLDAKGSVVTLDFDKYVPEITGDQVRDMLSPVFDFKALNQAEAYDLATDQWRTLASPQGRHGFGAATLGDTAYFAGGNKGCGGGDVTDELLTFRLR